MLAFIIVWSAFKPSSLISFVSFSIVFTLGSDAISSLDFVLPEYEISCIDLGASSVISTSNVTAS